MFQWKGYLNWPIHTLRQGRGVKEPNCLPLLSCFKVKRNITLSFHPFDKYLALKAYVINFVLFLRKQFLPVQGPLHSKRGHWDLDTEI